MIYVSPAYEQIWGRPCSELYVNPRNWLTAIHPDDRDRIRAAWEAAAACGEGLEAPLRLRRHDGGHRVFAVKVIRLPSADGLPVRWLGMAMEAADA